MPTSTNGSPDEVKAGSNWVAHGGIESNPTLFSLVCLALLLGCTQSKTAYWAGNSCTGELRVCRDGETPSLYDEAAGTYINVCRSNKFNRPTIVFDAGNWPSAMYNEWCVVGEDGREAGEGSGVAQGLGVESK